MIGVVIRFAIAQYKSGLLYRGLTPPDGPAAPGDPSSPDRGQD